MSETNVPTDNVLPFIARSPRSPRQAAERHAADCLAKMTEALTVMREVHRELEALKASLLGAQPPAAK